MCVEIVGVANTTDGVEQLLRRHGVQVTAQRLAIMNAVSSHPHATADELTDDDAGDRQHAIDIAASARSCR